MEKAIPLGRAKNLAGKKFGRLTAIERVNPISLQSAFCVWWRCQCECGQIASVSAASLMSGKTKSCGCLRREVSARIIYKARRAKENG